MNGFEMLLRSMMGAETYDKTLALARQFVESGSLEKLLKFADDVGPINERLERIERELRSGVILRTVVAAPYSASDESLSGTGRMELVGASDSGPDIMSDDAGADFRLRRAESACRDADDSPLDHGASP